MRRKNRTWKKFVEILIEEDIEKARILADGIETYNKERKELDQNITKKLFVDD